MIETSYRGQYAVTTQAMHDMFSAVSWYGTDCANRSLVDPLLEAKNSRSKPRLPFIRMARVERENVGIHFSMHAGHVFRRFPRPSGLGTLRIEAALVRCLAHPDIGHTTESRLH